MRLAFLLLLLTGVVGGADEEKKPPPLRKRLAKAMQSVRSFRADFEQEKKLRVFKKPVTSSGVLFFERLKRHYGDAPRALAIISTHPMTADRIAALRRRSSDGDDAMTDAEWQALLAVCGETAGID